MLERLTAIIQPAVEGLGYEFWGVELLGASRDSLLRVYIEGEQAITITDCETVSRQISRVLDIEDPLKRQYVLEVSSPGIERPLFYPHQYQAYCGETISIQLNYLLQNRKRFKGQLKQVSATEVTLEMEGVVYILPFDAIDKARLLPVVVIEKRREK